MAVIDRDLIRAINSGRCFALIGSGLSCELGVPSWKSLAEIALKEISISHDEEIIRASRELLAKKRYPELFSLAERIIGREGLLALINRSLIGTKQTGILYQYVASWPFACYLTTNFDDYLKQHLDAIKVPVVVRRNTQHDMRVLRSTSKDLLIKIHGDFSVPMDIVLTAEQYEAYRTAEEKQYWRDTILSVLKMMDLIILGYSIEDPDFRDQLERAKKIAAPNHPVFLFAADMNLDEVRYYYQRYNIRVITYNNEDGTHHDLHGILRPEFDAHRHFLSPH